jgi:hypothetical protein
MTHNESVGSVSAALANPFTGAASPEATDNRHQKVDDYSPKESTPASTVNEINDLSESTTVAGLRERVRELEAALREVRDFVEADVLAAYKVLSPDIDNASDWPTTKQRMEIAYMVLKIKDAVKARVAIASATPTQDQTTEQLTNGASEANAAGQKIGAHKGGERG